MIIGIIGLIGAGKGTVGDMLIEQGFSHESFANPLKDTAASIFNWDREMLEGITLKSRVWREEVDSWWEERLNIPDFSPRLALQLLGTEVFRNHFHQDTWILSMESRLRNVKHDVVITDARFPNEIAMVRRQGGVVVRVKRGDDPEWFKIAETNVEAMPQMHPDIHASEYSWCSVTPNYLITNDGSVKDLLLSVTGLLEDLRDSTQL
jgi:hypothetical protein